MTEGSAPVVTGGAAMGAAKPADANAPVRAMAARAEAKVRLVLSNLLCGMPDQHPADLTCDVRSRFRSPRNATRPEIFRSPYANITCRRRAAGPVFLPARHAAC